MKRYTVVILGIALCAILSGCSANNNVMTGVLLQDNAQYNEYLSLLDEHKSEIDESGKYRPNEAKEAMATSDVRHGSIRVSFASNSLLNTAYYYDADHNEVIDTESCYLNPGETIYTSTAIKGTVQSNTYEASGYKMLFWDNEQLMQESKYFEGSTITIPNDTLYTRISIIPNGHYKNRELSLLAECKNDDGSLDSINPVWTIKVGGQEYKTKAESYSVGATSSFRVEAEYDANKYYLIEDECIPRIESSSDKYGTVLFKQYDAQSAENEYKLTFGRKHEFQIGSIVSDGTVTIIVDGEIFDNPEFPFTYSAKLKDEVEIESSGKISEVNGVFGLERQDINGYIYKVVNSNGTIELDPSTYKYDHGKVSFYDLEHKQITQKTELTIGDYIYYVGEPDEGYSFSMNEGENKYKVDLNTDYFLKNELKFTSKQKYELPQSSVGGTITYYLNGEELKSSIAYISPDADKLTASFTPDNRYVVNNMSDHAECVVKEDNHEIKFIDNGGNEIDVENVFKYSEAQKADLNVTVDGNVGTETKFYIYNGTKEQLNVDQQSFKPADWFGDSHQALDDGVLLENTKIQTDAGIKVSVSDWSPLKNEAMRLRVISTDNNNVKTTQMFYILTAGGSCSIITDTGDSIYYKNIEINISKVTGAVFNSRDFLYDNASVSFNYDDTSDKEALIDGEFIDDSRNIHMLVTAKSPYVLKQHNDLMFWDANAFDIIQQYEDRFAFSQISEKYNAMKEKTRVEQ